MIKAEIIGASSVISTLKVEHTLHQKETTP